jgi:class 3 adenylate cyclase
MTDLRNWLRAQGLEEYFLTFSENDIDFDILRELSDADLKELGLSLGHRRRLLRALAEDPSAPPVLIGGIDGAATNQSAAADKPPQPAPERRHLTVMFCDLVGSTDLSTRLDPEDLSGVISAYQAWCARIVGQFGGFVAKCMGDGVLVYFGYPQAHEDDAERAVHAALRLVAECGSIVVPADYSPMVRVGIASGLVVVGELVGEGMAQEQSVVGETPNLAARLQAIADPQTVVIAPGTQRLLGDVFEYSDLGTRELKGFAQPVHAHRVLGVKSAESRFEARRSSALTPFVGRDIETSLLLERWQQAKDAKGKRYSSAANREWASRG